VGKSIFLLLITLFLLFSCAKKEQKELRIATNAWIGYTPLFYARKKGYLEKLGIKLVTNVSLAEASAMYDTGKADMVTTTQHEYYSLKRTGHDIVPVILLDRSDGGDMVLSNKDIESLRRAAKIYVYLEIDSINTELIKDFVLHYGLDTKKMVYINKDQAQIEDLQPSDNEAMLLVTYVPYNLPLQKRGFKVLASTKMDTLVVIDALCTSKRVFKHEKERLLALKKVIDQSILDIMKDPEASYALVKSYIGNISFDEYLEALKLIKWINKPSPQLLKRIEPIGYKGEYLIP